MTRGNKNKIFFEDLSYSSVKNLTFNILGQIFKKPSQEEPILFLPFEMKTVNEGTGV